MKRPPNKTSPRRFPAQIQISTPSLSVGEGLPPMGLPRPGRMAVGPGGREQAGHAGADVHPGGQHAGQGGARGAALPPRQPGPQPEDAPRLPAGSGAKGPLCDAAAGFWLRCRRSLGVADCTSCTAFPVWCICVTSGARKEATKAEVAAGWVAPPPLRSAGAGRGSEGEPQHPPGRVAVLPARAGREPPKPRGWGWTPPTRPSSPAVGC